MDKLNLKYGFCGKVHAKVFEIILIFGFIISIGSLIAYFLLTWWFIKYSDYLVYGVYGLIAINALSLIFTIILRIWRCNDSVLKDLSSSSKVISIIILILIIINFLCSIAEDVLYYLSISYFFGYDKGGGSSSPNGSGDNNEGWPPDDNDDEEESSDIKNEDKRRYLDVNYVSDTKMITIVVNNDINSDIVSIIDNSSFNSLTKSNDAIINEDGSGLLDINTDDDKVDNDSGGGDNKDSKEKKYMYFVLNKINDDIFGYLSENSVKGKRLILKPLIIMNVNPFMQIISLIFIIFIIKRINIKSHYGINPLNQSSIRNQIGSTKNVRDINDDQNENIFTGNIKKGKNNRLKENNINKKKTTSSQKSEQLEIMENKRKKRKERNRKKNHKHKK